MKNRKIFKIDGSSLTINDVNNIAYDENLNFKVVVADSAKKKIKLSRDYIENKLKTQEAIYGVNTGFGLLSNVKIDSSQLATLQTNLIRSHAVGVGEPLSEPEVRAAILLRANTLAKGYSGVTLELIEALLALLNNGIHPYIPEKGSVGACGDLAPLAHLSLVLIGEGRAYVNHKLVSGAQALEDAKLTRYVLKAKEGLSLINGTQIMTAIGCLALAKAEKLFELANLAGALTVEACAGSKAPFDEAIQKIRPHGGQILVAEKMRKYLAHSEIMQSHKNCNKVQDPYSLRCIPQVHGTVYDTLVQIKKIVATEINSVTDNPLVFAKTKKSGKIVSGGNFHGEYVAMAMDQLAIAVAELASIAEQRVAKLINPSFSELPAFLIKDGGLNSGYMIVHVAAASLVSENKTLCHPAVVDSIPTSADKEDHVSMGTIAARKARSVVQNTAYVLAIELLAACQGLDFRQPLKPAKKLQLAYQTIRSQVSFAKADRTFHEDIEKVYRLMWSIV